MRILITAVLLLAAASSEAQAPHVSLQQAIQLAEQYLVENRVQNDHRYLDSAEWHYNHEAPGRSCWSLNWDVAASPPITDSHLLVSVCVDGSIRHQDDWA